jgi:hypothetical protein
VPQFGALKSARWRQFMGGSGAQIVIGQDDEALIRWGEKRGEVGAKVPASRRYTVGVALIQTSEEIVTSLICLCWLPANFLEVGLLP